MVSSKMSLWPTLMMLILTFDFRGCNRQQIGRVPSIRSNAIRSTRTKESASVLHRDSRSNYRYRRSVLNLAEMQEAIDAHNRLRRLEGASDMKLMVRPNANCLRNIRLCNVDM